jgi:hypothetical protein
MFSQTPQQTLRHPGRRVPSDWKKTRSDLKAWFGSRAFLINNLEIIHIPERILIDFEDPARNVIPDIGAR